MTSKKIFALILALMMVFSLAACSSSTEPAEPAESGEMETKTMARIGILQFAPHASLDNCYKGIVEGLADAGYVDGDTCTIDFVNGMGEGETNSMAAQKFVTDGCDVIVAIATPAATAA
ncbi:MAG: ABC transporter substrate-binding protein, partial [Firmicutes bacterium]|nr:ABC transporter substrate-binding protein [Bacillota bacterium]